MIDKVALLLVRDGKVLLCRKKRGTPLLILPGGKREAEESSLECLARELREELGDVRLCRLSLLAYTNMPRRGTREELCGSNCIALNWRARLGRNRKLGSWRGLGRGMIGHFWHRV
jgi:ADP-ribose pyrophosphatase YjhB (NUDIX family)